MANVVLGDGDHWCPVLLRHFLRKENPHHFNWLIWELTWGLRKKFFQAVVCISLEQQEQQQPKPSKRLSWVCFQASQQAGHAGVRRRGRSDGAGDSSFCTSDLQLCCKRASFNGLHLWP